jgi:RHS repeat-associated protein
MSLADTAGGRIDLSYDLLNRVVRETTAQGTIAYTYDGLGRRASMTVNGQAPVTYSYDAASRLTHITQGSQTVVIAYDAAGRRTSLTYPNGTITAYSYDASSRLIGIFHAKGATTMESISYGYDTAGNRTAAVRGSSPATFLPATLQAAYDAANEQVRFNSSTPNMTYDANGNLTSRTDSTGTTTYIWDARNRLLAVDGPNLTASFMYDALNRRIGKTINGVTTQYLYDRKNIVQEIANGAVTASYLCSLSIDEPFIRINAVTNAMEFYHHDALGTTLLLSDETGAVKTTYTYTPFGETTVTGSPSTNPFQYAGRENDGTGLYHYRMRYYSPVMHRFIQEDPIASWAASTCTRT